VPVSLLAGFWASEGYVAHSKAPVGVTNVAGYFRRFGDPLLVRVIEHDSQSYYEFIGHPGGGLTIPSGPPAYIFDAKGHFVEWCYDSSEAHDYRGRWPYNMTGRVDVSIVKQKFGL